MKKKHWYEWLWVLSAAYLILGFFNILFAWLGLLCFFIPLLLAIFGKEKAYCNRYCGRGQLFELLGGRLGLSRRLRDLLPNDDWDTVTKYEDAAAELHSMELEAMFRAAFALAGELR